MSRIRRVFGCAFAVLAIAGVAFAGPTQVTLVFDFTGDWSLSALASDESDGIAGYNIEILGF